MIPDDEIASMLLAYNASLPDTVSVLRQTLTSDGQGGQTATWASVATYACRRSPANKGAAERVIAARPTAVSAWTFHLPAGADVRPTDRLQSGERSYEVIAVSDRTWEIGRQADCQEIA